MKLELKDVTDKISAKKIKIINECFALTNYSGYFQLSQIETLHQLSLNCYEAT